MKIYQVFEKMFDEEVACSYCSYDNDCPHGMKCYGGNPIEPPCASRDNFEDFIDYESYCNDYEIELDESEDIMIPIKARYLKNEFPTGKEYTFRSNELVNPGDIVKVGNARAVVTEVNVPNEDVESFMDKLKMVEKVEEV